MGTDQDEFMWLVGLLEGEGSFIAARSNACRGSTTRNAPRVKMASRDRDVIERAQRAAGCGTICTEAPDKLGKVMHIWQCQRRDEAIALMQALLPHMCERRAARIREVLAVCPVSGWDGTNRSDREKWVLG